MKTTIQRMASLESKKAKAMMRIFKLTGNGGEEVRRQIWKAKRACLDALTEQQRENLSRT